MDGAAEKPGLSRGPLERACRAVADAPSEAALYNALVAGIVSFGARQAAVVRRRVDGSARVEASAGFSPVLRAWFHSAEPRALAPLLGDEPAAADSGPTGLGSAIRDEGLASVVAYPIRPGDDAWLLLGSDAPGPIPAPGEALCVLLCTARAASRAAAESRRMLAYESVIRELGGACFEKIRRGEWVYRGVSPELASLLGQSAEDLEAARTTALGVKHPADRDRCAFEIQRCVSAASPTYTAEYRVVRPAGEVARVREAGRVLESNSGGASRIIGVVAPSESPLAARLAAPPEMVESLFHRSPLAICDVSLDGRIIRVNEAFEAAFGATGAALSGTSYEDLLHADDLPAQRTSWAETASGRNPTFRLVQRLRRGDGRFEIVETHGFGTSYVAERTPVVRLLILEGRELMLARTELQQLRAKLRSFYEQSAVGMAEIALDGRILSSNPMIDRMLDRPAGDLVGRDWRSITHPADIVRCEGKLAELTAGACTRFSLEKRLLRRDGSVVWVVVAVSRVLGEDGALDRLAVVMYDVSDRRTLQERMGERAAGGAVAGRVLRVLVADDEPAVAATVCAMLEHNAFEAVAVANLAEARAALSESEPYDVVVCDAGLGGGDESGLLRELASAAPSTRAILMSGSPCEAAALLKPFSVEELTAAILDAAGVRARPSP